MYMLANSVDAQTVSQIFRIYLLLFSFSASNIPSLRTDVWVEWQPCHECHLDPCVGKMGVLPGVASGKPT